MFENLEVEDCLEHVVDDVDVELNVMVTQVIVETEETAEKSESSVLLLVLQDRSDKLRELFVSYVLKSVAILEVFVGPLDQVAMRGQFLPLSRLNRRRVLLDFLGLRR